MAQLVELRTGTPPTQVRIPGAERDFFPQVNFQCRLSHAVRTPPRAIACINICVHVKDPTSPCQSLVDYGNNKTPGMHSRLGSATLLQLAFPGEGNPNFPLGLYSCKKSIYIKENGIHHFRPPRQVRYRRRPLEVLLLFGTFLRGHTTKHLTGELYPFEILAKRTPPPKKKKKALPGIYHLRHLQRAHHKKKYPIEPTAKSTPP